MLLSEEWGGDLKNLKYHYLNIWRLNEADYATALKGLTPLAEKGNSDAQYILGKMRTGAPLWKKDKESNNRTECEFFEVGIKWLTLAAKGGHSQATVDLVFLYDRGVFGYPDCNIKNKGTSNKWDTIFKKLVKKKNIEADKIWNRYNSREKTLSEEVLNYSTMNKRSGIGLSENWLTNEKKNYYWVSERKNQCIVKPNYPYTNESGGNSFPKTINIKKLNRTAFRIGREFSNDKWKWIFSEGSTVILSVNDQGQDMATLQKAWRLLFRKCPGKKSRF